MVSLYTDPNGETLFTRSLPSITISKETIQNQRIDVDVTGECPENVTSLKARIKDLESQLAMKNTVVMLFCSVFVVCLCWMTCTVKIGLCDIYFSACINVHCTAHMLIFYIHIPSCVPFTCSFAT